MRKITDFIINKRYLILAIFIILVIVSGILSTKVVINKDITKYLPNTSETRIGMDIMEEEFSDSDSSSLSLMFAGLKEEEKIQIKEELGNIEYVDSVDYEIDNEKYNKDEYTLYNISVNYPSNSKEAEEVFNNINEKYKDYEIYTDGNIAEDNTEVLAKWIVVLAVLCALVILIIMCPSYVEPFLFLFVILLAVVLNKGTNIMFDNVSNITESISAILQMALSMDYSIMLMNRYDQEKENEKDKIKAMKNALYYSFKSISSSSITTIVGLLALVFMSFTIGRDLGLVLAKGVLLSLLCIFTCLPSLILIFEKWIIKTKKKVINIKLNRLGKASYKCRFVGLPLLVVVFVISFMLKGNLNIEYVHKDNNKISEVFPGNNQIAIIYKNENEDIIAKYCNEIEKNDGIEELLSYSNTINKELKYSEFNKKLEDLGNNTTIDDYLLKILYYNYYNKDTANKVTFNELINFIKTKVYANNEMSDKIDDNMKENIDKLQNFTNIDSINKKRSSQELANLFTIDKNNIDNLLVYYNSKNINTTLTINQFIDFMNKDVLTNDTYSSNIDESTRNNLNTLSKFIDKNKINKEMTFKEISNLFGIDENLTSQLFTYYSSLKDVTSKLTINKFADFLLNDVANDSNYSSLLDNKTLENVKLLSNLSNLSLIDAKMSSYQLSNLFNINEEMVKKIFLLNFSNTDNGTKMTVSNFVLTIKNLKENTSYLNDENLDKILKLVTFAENKNDINNTPMDKNSLSAIFGEELVNNVFELLKLTDKISPAEFINLTITNLGESFDSNTLGNLKLINLIMQDNTQYTSTQMANIFGIGTASTNQIYALNDYISNNTENWKMSPYDFVNFILNNSTNPLVSESLTTEMIQNLNYLKTIMDSSKNNIKYSYNDMSKLIGIDSGKLRNIYFLYESKRNTVMLSPTMFVKFILSHKDDSVLSGKIDNGTLNNLILINNIMDGVNNNKSYTHNELANLLGIDDNNLSILYSLYSSIYIDNNTMLSTREFVEFILNDVLNNETYGKNFDNEAISRLETVNNIINGSINSTEYSSSEAYRILSNLADDLDSNLIDLVYLYYGSENHYNSEWTLTVEKLINYLNDEILDDTKFDDFITDEMRNNITDSKITVSDAKKQLIGSKYSRVVINTSFDEEGDDVYNFISNIKENLSKDNKEIYVIGNSAMSYEMDKTFESELNKITIITMIAIFVVVAFTFKSLTIPTILIFIIQSAIYLTMGVLSFSGGGVYFIALLIVQSILMGATIDYAIVFTSYYTELRQKLDRKDAVINAYNISIHTILTSSSILIIVTFILGILTDGITSKICKTLSLGTLCSTILILVILPPILVLCDKFIIKKKRV